jgi:hypothetical protein
MTGTNQWHASSWSPERYLTSSTEKRCMFRATVSTAELFSEAWGRVGGGGVREARQEGIRGLGKGFCTPQIPHEKTRFESPLPSGPATVHVPDDNSKAYKGGRQKKSADFHLIHHVT